MEGAAAVVRLPAPPRPPVSMGHRPGSPSALSASREIAQSAVTDRAPLCRRHGTVHPSPPASSLPWPIALDFRARHRGRGRGGAAHHDGSSTSDSRPWQPPPRTTAEELLRVSEEMLGKGDSGTTYKAVLDDGAVMAVKRLRDTDLRGMLGKVRAPCVVVQSNHDISVPASVTNYLQEHLGGRTTVEFLQIEGHVPHLSAPGLLSQVLRRALAWY